MSRESRSAVATGHGESMEYFVEAERPALLRFFLRRAVLREDAEDAAQECFMRLLRYRDSKPAEAWRFLLYRIAASVAVDRVRRAAARRTEHHVQADDVPLASHEALPERALAARQELARLRDVILALPPKCQKVFLLSRIHGLTYAQIAEHCGVSVKTVEKHMHKAIVTCMAAADEEEPGR